MQGNSHCSILQDLFEISDFRSQIVEISSRSLNSDFVEGAIQPAVDPNPQFEIRIPKSRRFSGDFVGRVTPVPIPNTEVKPAGADGTARVTVWESRKSPGLF